MIREKHKYLYAVVLGDMIILIDQVVKFFITVSGLEYSKNTGISFGIFNQSGALGLMLNLLGFFVLAVIIVALFKGKRISTPELALVSALVGASISNLIDRVIRGGVIDYIDLKFLPAFNFADLVITSSLVLLVILIIKDSNVETNSKS